MLKEGMERRRGPDALVREGWIYSDKLSARAS